eukprot:CAMPEP_0202488098 /NCGR_PEP_ID=MMETSP1361-20130828/6225_1 /ASSEMBLY_ACC=CAM_ASM_000849 /TAXON_ID=210615 /ORGANISM="Staurosira complex sp., Strain CCMP2646" /LENGTH=122 /DNA_ID=CAMNT_0049117607 /DNA_START=452 /DNA_END=821 /DNA_ORIENTATION=+
MTNVNFTTPEDTTASAEEWMQRTVSENLAWQQAMNQAKGNKPAGTQTQPNVKGTEGEEAAVQEEAYEWTQTEEEIEVRVPRCSNGGEKWDKSKLQINLISCQSPSISNMKETMLRNYNCMHE